MGGQNLAWRDFRKRVKEKRGGGKRKPYYRFKKLLYFKRFQESWKNTN